MTDQIIKFVVAAALLVHGLGHGGALGGLIWYRFRPGDETRPWSAARAWLFPSLPAPTAIVVASVFWVLCLIGFVSAALSFWGILLPGDMWRPLAAASAIVSILGIALFLGTWPTFNTLGALAMNIAVLVTQLWLHWPPQAIFGK
jgi:hypothetical protein